MAFNRHIRVDERVYVQSSFLEIDTTVIQLPADEGPDIKFELHADSSERIELTHQQLCRGVAALLLAGFLVFLVGYTTGGQRATSRMPVELLPSSLYNASVAPVQVTHQGSSDTKICGRFATRAEAATLCKELTQKGLKVRTHLMVSRNVSGVQHFWYQVRQD